MGRNPDPHAPRQDMCPRPALRNERAKTPVQEPEPSSLATYLRKTATPTIATMPATPTAPQKSNLFHWGGTAPPVHMTDRSLHTRSVSASLLQKPVRAINKSSLPSTNNNNFSLRLIIHPPPGALAPPHSSPRRAAALHKPRRRGPRKNIRIVRCFYDGRKRHPTNTTKHRYLSEPRKTRRERGAPVLAAAARFHDPVSKSPRRSWPARA